MQGSETAGSVPKRSRREFNVIGVPSTYVAGANTRKCVSACERSVSSEKGIGGASPPHLNGSFKSSSGPIVGILSIAGIVSPLRRMRHVLVLLCTYLFF